MSKKEIDYPFIEIDELKPYENNARLHPQEQIDKITNSIKEFGFITPVIIDENNTILVGHGRTLGAKQAGLTQVPYRRITNLTDEQKRAYILADNKLSDIAEWDEELLKMELESITLDMTDFGFEDFEINIDEDITEIEEDKIPEPPVEPKTKLGDIYKLGRHRLICGDSTDVNVIDKLMDGAKADMVFTDPPYGNGTSGKYGRGQLGVRTIAGDEDLSVFNEFISIMNTDKIVYFLQWITLVESFETIRKKGLRINTVGVWDKKNAGLNGAGGISEQWEAVIFAGNIKYKKFGGNVFSIAREQHKREDSPHPHQKPIKLLAEIFDFLNDCENILDPFGGSGSTLITCEQLGRTCYMCELDPKYVDVIIERWENFTGQKAELIKGGE